jgi:uncharacterized membrane protein YfcA
MLTKYLNKIKLVKRIWLLALAIAFLIIILMINPTGNIHLSISSVPKWIIIPAMILLSGFCEYIDSSLGMGYGTTLTPLLLTFGAIRNDLVPAILLSEFITGLSACFAHNHEGNVNFKTDKNIRTAALFLVIPSVIGVVAAIFAGNRLHAMGKHYATLYVGIMIFAIGVWLLYRNYFGKKGSGNGTISRPKLLILGTIAAFNKGISGGGYGPLMTGGQMTAGVNEKEAVVITSLCECFTCFTGLIVFFSLGGKLNLFYTIPLCAGSILSVVPAAKTVKILPQGVLKKAIGWATMFLGALVLWKFI